MKKSAILLLGGVSFILLIVLSLIIFFRVAADRFMSLSGDSEALIEGTGIIETRDMDFKNFNSLEFENVWDVDIREGKEYKISLTADRALFDEIEISQNSKTLSLNYDKYIRSNSNLDDDVHVLITMPDIEEIEFNGMGNINFENFILDRLEIRNSGASNIEAENVSIDQLNLIVSGAANAELSNINITNCLLSISGAANIELNMTGGELEGSISGAASVVYRGQVSDESVVVSGIGTLERRK